jgi:hypothetical protein
MAREEHDLDHRFDFRTLDQGIWYRRSSGIMVGVVSYTDKEVTLRKLNPNDLGETGQPYTIKRGVFRSRYCRSEDLQ